MGFFPILHYWFLCEVRFFGHFWHIGLEKIGQPMRHAPAKHAASLFVAVS